MDLGSFSGNGVTAGDAGSAADFLLRAAGRAFKSWFSRFSSLALIKNLMLGHFRCLWHKGLSLLPVVPVVPVLLLLRVVRVSLIFAKRRIRQVFNTIFFLGHVHNSGYTIYKQFVACKPPAPPAGSQLYLSARDTRGRLYFRLGRPSIIECCPAATEPMRRLI